MKALHLQVVILVITVGGCRAEPNGASLRCNPGSCATGMRCYEGVCIFNTLPELEPFEELRIMPVGASRTFTARASNPEADPLVFEWSQTAGPTESFVTDGADLVLTPEHLGMHLFRVTADDGFLGDLKAPATELRVMVVPAVDTHDALLFVSELAHGASGCGSHDSPCPTVADAVREARGAPTLIVVAANRTDPAYRECLRIRGDVTIMGSFDPATWVRESNPEPSTTFECYRCEPGESPCGGCASDDAHCGHELGPSAAILDVQLSLEEAMTPAPGEQELATVWLVDPSGSSGAMLDGVDVRAPLCGPTCTGIGVVSLGASPTILGVNIYGGGGPQATNDNAIGLLALGGTLVLGPASPRNAPVAGRRSSVNLTAPALGQAIGLLANGAGVSIRQVDIFGTAAPRITGIELRDSTATVEESLLDLTVDGPGQNFGVLVRSCSAKASICPCVSSLGDCTPTASPLGQVPGTILRDNIVSVRARARFGVGACAVAGLELESPATDTSLERNTIDVRAAAAVAVGIEVGGDDRTAAVDTEIIENTVSVAHARADTACEATSSVSHIQDYPGGPVRTPAGVGISLHHATRTRVEDNRVSVDSAHDYALGLVATTGERHEILRNELTVGSDETSLATEAWAAVLGETDAVSLFEGNRAIVGAAAKRGIALRQISGMRWRVENNFLYGGDLVHCVGIDIAAAATDGDDSSSWPRLINNTVVAGGLHSPCNSSQTVAFDVASNVPWEPITTAAVFLNNILDGGHATGRRYVFANESATWFAAEANVAQMVGEAPSPGAVHLQSVGNGGWAVLLENAAQVVLTRNVSPSGGQELSRVDLLEPPTAHASVPALGGLPPAIAVGGQGGITLIDEVAELAPFKRIPLRAGAHPDAPALRPQLLAAGDLNDDDTADLLVWGAAAASPSSLWLVSTVGGSFSAAKTVLVELVSRNAAGQIVARTPTHLSEPTRIRITEASTSSTVYILESDSVFASLGGPADGVLSVERLPLGPVLSDAGLSATAEISDMNVLVGLGGRHELVLVADARLVSVSRFFFDAPTPGTLVSVCAAPDGTPQSFPCEMGGGILRMAARTVSSTNEVALACTDSTLEVYLLAPNDADPINEPAQLACSTVAPAVDTGLGEAGVAGIAIGSDGTVAVMDAGGNAIDVLRCNSNECFGIWSVDLLADIAARVHSDSTQILVESFSAAVDIVGVIGVFDATSPCPLVARADLPATYDLHLDSPGGDCAAGGSPALTLSSSDGSSETVLAPTTDIDSEVRDAPPDIGADEMNP